MPRSASGTFVIGIGGNIGAGKTTLAKIFQELSAKVIDADKIGWSLLKKSSKTYHKIIRSFGKSILDKNQNINRKKLGKIVFAHTKKLKSLNQIIHPLLLTKLRQKIRKQKGVVILDAALLFNWELEKEMDASVLVSSTQRLKTERATKAGMTKAEAGARISKQLPDRLMAQRADFIIKNNGTKKDLRNKAEELWQLFNKCRRL